MVLTKLIIRSCWTKRGRGRVDVHDVGEGVVGVDGLDVPAGAGDGEEVGGGEGAESAGPGPGELEKEEGWPDLVGGAAEG